MKIVQLEDFFHPQSGYQITILSKYLAAMGHDVTVVTSAPENLPSFLTDFFDMKNLSALDAEYTKKYGVKIVRVPIWAWKSGRAIQKCGYRRVVESLNPDLLYIHGESSIQAMRFLWQYKRLKYPLLLDSHMTTYAKENRFGRLFHSFYRAFILPVIKKYGLKVIRTQNTMFVNESLGIPLEQSPYISFGSDTALFKPDAEVKAQFRREHSISDNDFVVTYAGKFTPDKGCDLLADALSEKLTSKDGKNLVFVLVGNVPKGAEGEELERRFSESPNRIIRYPTQSYSNLPRFFQSADLCAIPAAASLSFFDMQACATPVLWEDEDISIERSSHENAFLFKMHDKADFVEKLLMCAGMDKGELLKVGENAYKFIKDNYDYADIARKYEAIILSEYERQRTLKASM